MQSVRHPVLPFKNLFEFARQNKARWIAPIGVVLPTMAAAMIVGHAIALFIMHYSTRASW